MTSLHHITHAVSVVIIAFLIKKYTELRSSHTNLRTDYQQLKLSCASQKPGILSDREGEACRCPPFQNEQTLRETRNQFETVASHSIATHTFTNSGQDFFASSVASSFNDMDDYGRTLKERDAAASAREKGGDKDSGTFTVPHVQLPPFHHNPHPSLQPPNREKKVSEMEALSARHESDLWTGEVKETLSNLQQTRESLEKVVPSPSSVFTNIDAFKSRTVAEKHVDNPPLAVGNFDGENPDSDFYLGSLPGLQGGEEGANVIVTEAENTIGVVDSLYPHGVNVSPGDEQFGDDDEWEYIDEEEDEEEGDVEVEKPHPAFGNVSLQWLTDQKVESLSVHGSSVRCTGTSLSDRTCDFHNLCFSPNSKQFVFLLSPKSAQENVPRDLGKGPLLELSTVAGHNAQYFSYSTMPSTNAASLRVAVIPGTTVVFKRFKPDNVMHVFHDDVIPLLHTLVHHIKLAISGDSNRRKFPASLFLADDNSEGEFYDLYGAFSANGAFTLNSLIASVAKVTDQVSLVCFSKAHVGLTKSTTWYQYGFFTPQGPIPNLSTLSEHIHSASSYLMNALTLECPLCGEGGHLVLISRKETRRILNEMDLVLEISKRFKVKVMTVSLETHSLADIIPIIHSSRGVIGMHGSLLSLGMFLKQGSIMVELFPYAVNPAKYTPYKTLCQIPGMQIAYRAWENKNEERSVPHKDWLPELGGIQELPEAQQRDIESQTEVPSHLCCEDPSWLYHIFQDTFVDIPEILNLISSALQEVRSSWTHTKTSFPSAALPGPVRNVQCRWKLMQGMEGDLGIQPSEHGKFEHPRSEKSAQESSKQSQKETSTLKSTEQAERKESAQNIEQSQSHDSVNQQLEAANSRQNSQGAFTLDISWTPPWDASVFTEKKYSYSILVQEVDSGRLIPFTVGPSAEKHTVTKGVKEGGKYRVWVRCVVDGVQCPFAGFAMCS